MPTWTKKVAALYQSVGSRIAFGVGAGLTLLANIPIEGGATFDIERAFAVATAIVIWLGAEMASARVQPDLHDVSLRQDFRDAARKADDLLRNHDFGNSFSITNLTPLIAISEVWKGPDYTFIDKKVQKQFEPLLAEIKAFGDHIGLHAGPTPAGGLATFLLHSEDEWNFSEKTRENIRLANDQATALLRQIETFEAVCISRIGSMKEGQARLIASKGNP